MQVLALQYDIAWEDPAANLATVRRLLSGHSPAAGSLIVLPEMGLTGFSMNPAKVADTPSREYETALCDLAREHRSWLVGGIVNLAASGRGLNLALVATPSGTVASRYAKIHPFSHTGEHRRYEAGSDIALVETEGFQLTPFVCYDLRFPEIFRTAARRGANLFAVIANWPEARHAHWRTLLQARAIENQAWVIGANRCGRDPKFVYPGGTAIIDPFGSVVAEAGDGETVLEATIEPEAVSDMRRMFPVLQDIREDWTHA